MYQGSGLPSAAWADKVLAAYHHAKATAKKTQTVFVNFEGPWAFARDPNDANSVFAFAPKTATHHDLVVQSSESKSSDSKSAESKTLAAGIYELALPAVRSRTPNRTPNIDPNVLSRVIERGLVADGRLGRFTAVISDRPGGLADLAAQIASTGASIKQVVHDRAFASSDVSAVNVLCTVETRNHEHFAELRAQLKSHGVETYDSK